MPTTLIVPGLRGSGPDHWQTWMEQRLSDCVRVVQADWARPDLGAWAYAIRKTIGRVSQPVTIVAHSFGCLAVVEASRLERDGAIRGALLVAPAEPSRFGQSVHISPTPLRYRSILVASRNDPWMTLAEAHTWAEGWGAHVVDLGAVGHINPESGFGAWPQGLDLLSGLVPEDPRHDVLHSRHLREAAFLDSLGDIA